MSSEQQVAAVVNALANTLVQDANVRKPAEELLRSNETVSPPQIRTSFHADYHIDV